MRNGQTTPPMGSGVGGQVYKLAPSGIATAEIAQAMDVRSARAGDHGHDPVVRSLAPYGLGVVHLVAQNGLGAWSWTA